MGGWVGSGLAGYSKEMVKSGIVWRTTEIASSTQFCEASSKQGLARVLSWLLSLMPWTLIIPTH